MKKTFFLFLLSFATLLQVTAQEINWVTLEEAVALQKKNPKKIMMDVYTNWCGPCKMLDKNTFQNKDVVAYVNKNYYAVKFNAEGNDVVSYNGNTFSNPGYKPELAKRRNAVHQLTRHLEVSAYPTIVFLDEQGNKIAPIVGYKQPQQLELYLKMFKNDDHKAMDTQQKFNDYYKAFTPQFTN
ncbi:MAG TPA: thioredoxin fold domain-containing protein [Flavobacteriaceae bacterium]|nr:thioredoxin fold domain-containing protein [Flavobacteriaceae bacterium]